MNIFVLDLDPERCARYHCDKHVVKMITESAQMLCRVINNTGQVAPYRGGYKHHPCTIWAGESLANWRWLRDQALHLYTEYQHRYGDKVHKAGEVIKGLAEPDIPDIGLTPFAQAMPDIYKDHDAVVAYRNYYRGEKAGFATWRNRRTPRWFQGA